MKNLKSILLLVLFIATSCSNTVELTFNSHSILKFSDENDGINVNIVAGSDSIIAKVFPVKIQIYENDNISDIYSGYSSVKKEGSYVVANAEVKIDDVIFLVEDKWALVDDFPTLERSIKVSGDSPRSFSSAIEFEFDKHSRENTEYFVPGMIYGSTDNLTKTAIGGAEVYSNGNGKVWIREDRMPAPLMAFRFDNGLSFSILNITPNGETTIDDAQDVELKTIIDENLRFGSLYAEQKDNTLKTGYSFPGSEGEYSYQGNTYPGGQHHKWRRRFHPIKDGFIQTYSLSFNSEIKENFQSFYSSEWKRSFSILNPKINHQDIEQARESMLSIIPKILISKEGKTGLSNWYDATDATDKIIDKKAVFGFTGKNIEIAYYLLYNSDFDSRYKNIANNIISSFLDLKVNPPAGEGYYFKDGKPALAIPHHKHIYLRSYGDAMKVLAKAYKLEKSKGVDHKEWLSWMTDFANWVLTQQYDKGGFPRAWKPITGEISVESPASSYNIIPFFCEMHEITGEDKWLNAAIRTGEFSWESGHQMGRFVGGTIDNPDVLDKEAGTLSTEAYLELYESTKEKKWLQRAEIAAQYSETWMYIWNVPMPENYPQSEWTKGVPTVGIQLISTGHSLTDNYMAFDVDEYAKLYKYTGNQHYFDVAKILLHNTKGMLALPERKYQYRASGWIQEHWSMAPPRGKALHPGWLPWVTTSNLNGICETEIFDEELFDKLKDKTPAYIIKNTPITVDGNIDDWKDIEGIEVANSSKLWIGQGMIKENWKGKEDLSFTWKAAYSSNKIYFVFDVSDDVFLDSAQQKLSYLNDVIEIMLDPNNKKGDRFEIINNKKHLNGYEMHFLPSRGNEVFIDDSLIPEYRMDLKQNDLFSDKWEGEIASSKTNNGYVLELGFKIPDTKLISGKEIGLDVDVCDDDGNGRKSLLLWSGENNEFWLTMEKYLTVKFE
ncbi:MAG: sugar-binding protein [Bacteroidota bacterium]